MAYPTGAKFRGRIGKLDYSVQGRSGRPEKRTSYFFVCQKDHSNGKRYIRRSKHRADIENVQTVHDAREHAPAGYRDALAPYRAKSVPPVGILFDEFLAELEARVMRGEGDEKTVKHYRQAERRLFHNDSPIRYGTRSDEIDEGLIQRYVTWRQALVVTGRGGEKRSTQGARLVKELKALATVLRSRGLPVQWRQRRRDVRPVRRTKRLYSPEEIAAFVAAMEPGSIERAFTIAKARTCLRNEELYNLTVSNVLRDEQAFCYRLRNKQGEWITHRQPVTQDVIDELRAHLAGKRPGDFVFLLNGRKLGESSLRKRFLAASARMNQRREADGLKPFVPITGLKDFRTTGISTAAALSGNIRAVADLIGHRSVTTTEIYKLMTPDEWAVLRSIAEAAAVAVPFAAGGEKRG
jgi:integrase